MARLNIETIRRIPAYPIGEAAHYLNVPASTLRAWCVGQTYFYKGKRRRFEPLFKLDGEPKDGLSFLNLIEAHVLVAIRRYHHVPLPVVRDALRYVAGRLGIRRPLADVQFQTDGASLFVEKMGRLVNVSKAGQIEMATLIEAFLSRIERDAKGAPIKLYPFTRKQVHSDSPAPVVIDPRIAFGRPVLNGRAVPTAILADRFKAGDTLKELANDYEATTEEVEEAIRCELDRREAA